MKFLVVGLGNPGAEYAHTRHNIGFDVLDEIAKKSNGVFTQERHGLICRIKIRGKVAILLKPNTFMNLSGKAVNYWMQQEHVPLNNLLVVTDDLALPPGTIRIRLKGSDGGHNGLKSINETLNTTEYARLRFGIGSDFPKGHQADYVLSVWGEDQALTVAEKTQKAVEAITQYIGSGPVFAMNQFND
ncbi:MAG: aminoacyl-tRNA hydrolase [Bacteroidota bacterium]